MTNIKYAGKDFRQDLGLYVDSIESYGTPKKSYTFHEVLGRNGSLAVDDHRFEDHEETFNCYIRQDFVPNFRTVQAFFNSLKGYQRLERSNEPDYFEMGLYEGEISPRPTQLLQGGAFPFRLRLHPEKWLKSGETAVDAASTSETLEGNPIQFENPSGLTALTGLSVDIQPVQSGEGDPSPTNIRPITGHTSATVTRTVDSSVTDYTIDLNGTVYGGTLDVSTGMLTVDRVSVTVDGSYSGIFGVVDSTVTNPNGKVYIYRINQPWVDDYNDIVLSDSYIRSDHTAASLEKNEFYGSAGSGGTRTNNYLVCPDPSVTDIKGVRTWLAEHPFQLVYPLAEPQTVQLTPKQVSLLTGTNIISTDMDSLTVTISSPAELENPTFFESKPLIRIYGTGTVNINNDYITIDSSSPFTFIDLDCETMNASSAGNNANQYIEILNDAEITLKPGTNYVAYSGSITKVEITPRWYTI